MTCKKYILSDEEVQIIISHFILTEKFSEDLRGIVRGIELKEDEVERVVAQLVKIDASLSTLKPLVEELYQLQVEEE